MSPLVGQYGAVNRAAINAAKSGTRDLIAAPGDGYQIAVLGMSLCGSAGDGTATFIDSTPTTHTGVYSFDVDAQPFLTLPVVDSPHAWILCAENTKLQVTLSANLDLDGIVIYEIRATA